MCRSFLTTYIDENNKPKYYGRLTNKVTLNFMNALNAVCTYKKLYVC